MSENKYMEAVDAISGSLAQCYMTIDEKKYNFMQIYKFESKIEKKIAEIPILGKTGKGHKSTGWSGTWSGTAHYNQSILRGMLDDYKKTGIDKPFIIEVTNEDKGSSIGSQTIKLENCLTDGGILAMYDSSAEFLEEEITGTFDDFEIVKKFEILSGMES